MDMSPQGRQELTLLEGLRTQSYQDSVGVWTIGVGHTAAAGAPAPKAGMTITAAQADAILSTDLQHVYEPAVLRNVRVSLRQCEFDGLLSWTFNLGEGALKTSTMLRKLNAGDKQGAGDAMLAWNRAGGQVLAGLTRRRNIERSMFLEGLYPGVRPSLADSGETIKAVVTLAQGSKGPGVIDLQTDLAGWSFYHGKLDGDFGPRTKAAVQAFQRAHGLGDDGVVGLKTRVAIDAAKSGTLDRAA